MTSIADLQAATLAARQRTGDRTIGANVAKGRYRIVRVSYPKGPRAHVEHVAGPFSLREAVAFLNSMGATE